MKSVLQTIVVALCLVPLTEAQSVYMLLNPSSATAYPNIQAAVTAAGTTGWVVIPSSYQSAAAITSFSITSNVVTFSATNTLQAGQGVAISGLSIGTYLNGSNLIVLSTGLSSSQFEAAFTHANVASTSDSGQATCCNDTWTNPDNIRVMDERPFNRSGSATYVAPPQPRTTVKAAEYGAKCDGTADDYPAINAAVTAMTNIIGDGSSNAMVPAAVELPQGHCSISQPIVLKNYGSLQGSKNGTWLSMWGTFSQSEAMVQVVMTYQFTGNNISTINRYVKDINFEVSWSSPSYDVSGISVYNQTGTSSSMPYPYNSSSPGSVNWLSYQLPGVTISGNSFYAMDTGVIIDDCNNCSVYNNQFNFVRRGIVDEGNTFILDVHDNAVQQGWDGYSHTGGTTYGYYAPSSEERWICTNSGCTSTAQTATATPQGCGFSHNQVSTFDTDLEIINCQGANIDHNGFDYGGSINTGTANSTISIGANAVEIQMDHNFIGQNQCNAPGVYIGAPTGNPGDSSSYYQGTWFESNWLTTYCTSSPQGPGILFDAGSYPRRNVYITNNQFSNFGYGAIVYHPLQYSVITGNYAFGLNYNFFVTDVSGGGNFQGTVFSNNTTPDAKDILYETTAASNLQIGYNMSGPNTGPTQLTGTQTASGAGCPITAGAIGNTCTTAATIYWPIPFADAVYTVACSLQSPSYPTGIGTAGILSKSAVQVNEVALSANSVGGGTIVCTAVHQ